MNKTRNILISFFMMAFICPPVEAGIADSIDVCVEELADSLNFRVTTYDIETQLTFLMQGLTIRVDQPDTLTFSFPSAPMVRDKVKRHPNEVKAVLSSSKLHQSGIDSINHIVRPDVQPLVTALNDTTAVVSYNNMFFTTHDFKIVVDREKAIVSFNFLIHKRNLLKTDGVLNLFLSSSPLYSNGQIEFTGRQLSEEKHQSPNGLGSGIRKEDVAKRSIQLSISVKTVKNNY